MFQKYFSVKRRGYSEQTSHPLQRPPQLSKPNLTVTNWFKSFSARETKKIVVKV